MSKINNLTIGQVLEVKNLIKKYPIAKDWIPKMREKAKELDLTEKEILEVNRMKF